MIYVPGASEFVTVTLFDRSDATGSIQVTRRIGNATKSAGHPFTLGGVVSTTMR